MLAGVDPAVLAGERLVLGAVVRGTLRPADVDAAEVVFVDEGHARIADVLLVACPAPLALLVRLCARHGAPAGCWAGLRGAQRVLVGYLPTLARAAPARRGALAALRGLETAAETARLETLARGRREKSVEVRALRAALDAALEGDTAAALARMGRAERAFVGVSGPELAQIASGGGRR